MSIIILFLFFVSVALLVWLSSVHVSSSAFSPFELKRRAQLDPAMQRTLKREGMIPAVRTLLMLKRLIVLATTSWLAVLALGWLWGVFWTLLIIILLQPLGKLPFIHRPSQQLFDRFETWVMTRNNFKGFARVLANRTETHLRQFHSREELAYTIEQSDDILTTDEKKLLSGALLFRDKTVKQVMTPKKDMVTVSAHEFLGPLVLSEFHAKGHSRLPVVGKDIHHVVGVLYLQDLLSLQSKKSLTAEKAMDPKVHYVGQNDSLETALGIFLRSHHHLCIVLGEDGQTVGLVTIEDVLEALIGRKILDEDDPAQES